MATQVKEEITLHKGNGRSVLKEAAAVVDRVERKEQGLVYAVTADDLGATQILGAVADVPQDLLEGYQSWLEDHKPNVVYQAEQYARRILDEQRKKTGEIAPQIGEMTVASYRAFDVYSYSPLELLSGPMMTASAPNKILRGTNFGTPNVTWAAYQAVVWTNPVPSIPFGFAVPPTIQLGGHTMRIGFDVMNVTAVSAGPGFAFNIALPPVVPPLLFVSAFFMVPNVTTPQLYELNVTADIVESPRPYSAFATWHGDIDEDLFTAPEWQHDAPNRFMIYPF